ncbi:M55 family metallopeptidase [Candidatus Bipolaricaulota bacterium]
MKVFMSVDMEGITGIAVAAQTAEDHSLYKRGCSFMVGDVNAAIEGALAAGAREILVNDSHGSMTNIELEKLNPQARLLSGVNKPLFQMEGVQDCDVAFFIGYHSKFGTLRSTLDHTYWGSLIDSIAVNGVEMGEPEMNAVLAGAHDVPVVFLSGDEVTCAEAKVFIGDWLETAAVKRATGRESAICLHPEVTKRLIREGSERGLKGHLDAQPCLVDLPLTLDMKFLVSKMADQAAIFPYAERLDGRTVRVETKTVEAGYRVMLTMFALARNSL